MARPSTTERVIINRLPGASKCGYVTVSTREADTGVTSMPVPSPEPDPLRRPRTRL